MFNRDDSSQTFTNIIPCQIIIFFFENPAIAKKIVEKGILASKARIAAKRAREVTRKKSGLEISNLPGKLAEWLGIHGYDLI